MSNEEVSHLNKQSFTDQGIGEPGGKEFVLKNGVKVVLMPDTLASNLKKGNIALHGFSPYGASSFSKEDYFSAINAPFIVKNTGVGSLDKFQLNRFLSNTSFSLDVQPYIDFQESGIKGKTSLMDFEILLQLVYLYFTQPREDKRAFKDWKKNKQKEYIYTPYNLPNIDMKNKIKAVLGDSTYINAGTLSHKGISKVDLKRATYIYKKLFGNAQDFTFLISGNFNRDSILPLVQKYLGNLTNCTDRLKVYSNPSSNIPALQKPYREKFISNRKMENVNYILQLLPTYRKDFDWKENIKIELLGAILKDKMLLLRTKGYGIYSPKANGYYNHNLSRYITSLRIECDSSELFDIQKEIKKIMLDMKSGIIREGELGKALEYVRVIHSSQMNWVMKRVYQHYRYDYPWISQREINDYLNTVSLNDIIKTAKKYYKEKYQYEFVMDNEIE